MVRVINCCCFAITALFCLALYHVSEQTRVTWLRLLSIDRQIVVDRAAMKVLQADWERVSQPAHIQALAQSRLGLSDTAAASLASLELLPRRGESTVATTVQTASALAPTADPRFHLVAAHAGN